MQELLDKYKNKRPEIIFNWNDELTDAQGWVVINSLRNGAAGGGTRMRKGLNIEEVISLAKVMEVKFSVCGPPIGGAKSGINFDPNDPRRDEVLQRWYKAVIPLLKSYYGTGGDLNVDELRDVIPITEDLGLWHPQEGIVKGHLNSGEGQKINVIGQLRQGVSKTVENETYTPDPKRKFAIADLITGYGVAESVFHTYKIYYDTADISGKRVILQGWGNVASAAAYYLSNRGALVVGIIDKLGGVSNKDGFNHEEITKLYLNKKGNKIDAENFIPFDKLNQTIWDLGAEIFIPGAASKLITRDQADRLMENGLEVMACGANVPFIDDDVFFGPTAKYVDSKISLVPDFISNCGMARVFAYLMGQDVEITDAAMFEDVSNTIYEALLETYKVDSSRNSISTSALKISLNKLI